jgi:hypothetical protein
VKEKGKREKGKGGRALAKISGIHCKLEGKREDT